jgi:glutamate/tyrosine decarboxylase-like PLP-dependent enzyme
VERHIALAKRLGSRIEQEPEFELLAPVKLNIVCFRHRPPGLEGDELDAHNLALAGDVLADARVFFGSTRYEGKVAFRPAIVNWRTTERDIDLLADVVLELGAKRASLGPPG